MSPKYMLDTNICIYLMKHQPAQVKHRFDQCFVGEVVISAITLAELEYGVTCSGAAAPANRRMLESFTEDVPVVAFDTQAANAYGPTRFANRDRSRDALDKLIAAHAIALGVTLVTNNESDFSIYPELALENWVGQPPSPH
jgi:tRNA(fMet)-specific endonuclease VapC